MRSNEKKILSVLLLGLFVGASIIPSITGTDSSTDDTIKDIIIIAINNENDLNSLESYDITILETYDTAILVEILSSDIPLLEQQGYEVRSLAHRTLIYVRDLVFDRSAGEPDIPSELYQESYDSDEAGLFLVHMIGPVAIGWRPMLEDLGVHVLNYVHHYAYKVRMTPEQAEMAMDLSFVDWVGVYHPYYKLERDLELGLVTIGLVPGASSESLDRIQEETNIISFVETSEGYRFVCDVQSQEVLYDLASMNDVTFLLPYAEPELHAEVDSQLIGGGVWFMDDDDNPSTPYRVHGDYGAYINQIGYTGEGVVIAVADTGIGNGTVGDAGHEDFTGRVIGGYFWSGSGWQDGHGHGTHCSGSAAGDTYGGTGLTYAGHGPYYVSQGLAYESDLFAAKIFSDGGSWSGPDDYFEIVQIPKQQADAYIHSNSWGYTWGSGTYAASDNAYDRAARDADTNTPGNQPMVITNSAGNSGPSYQSVGSPGNAKNVITIGATESYMPDSTSYGNEHYNGNNPDNVVSFSSRGWTADNRVKPDVVATGQAVLSTHSPVVAGSGDGNLWGMYSEDIRYEWCSGTSMSNPAVAGAAAVTVQWYEVNHENRPSPAMVKALLINTAQDLDDTHGNTGPIPNRDEGWGMVDISKLRYPYDDPVSFYLRDQEHVFTESGQSEEYLIMSDREGVPLKVSLVWTDKAAPSGTGSGRTLINDLHLEVESPSGETYRGNAFSDGWTEAGADTMSDFDYSGDGWDDTNTVENVYIHPDDVELGIYTVRVIADNIVDDAVNLGYNSQDYALVVYNGMEEIPGEPPSINLLSPNGGEVWDARTIEPITWTTVEGNDSIDSVMLWFSTNNGSSWTLIDTDIEDTGEYLWHIPNVHSTQCLVRARVRDILGRRGENVSVDVFTIEGVPPAPPENRSVIHTGISLQTLFADDVEDGDAGYITGTSHAEASTWAIRQLGASSGVSSWDFGNGSFNKQATGGEGMLSYLVSPAINIPSTACEDHGVLFSFQHWRDWGDSSRYDAGNVKISTDGNDGPWTLIVPEEGYDGTVPSSWGNPLAGELAWGGTSDWTIASFDLTEYIGENIHIRWDAGVEAWSGLYGAGWRVDDLYLEALVVDEDGVDHNLLTWDGSPDEGIGEVSHYHVYRAENETGPWDMSTFVESVPVHGSSEYEFVDLDKGLADDVYWWYVVRAVGKNGLEDANTHAVPEPGEGVPPSVTLLSPVGDDVWEGTSDEWINWSTVEGDDLIESVLLRVSFDNGSSWDTIASGLDDTSSFLWSVPNVDSSHCLVFIRVYDTVGRRGEDTSDVFTILGVPPAAPEDLMVVLYGESVEVLFEDEVEEDLGYITGTSHAEASTWAIRQLGASSGVNSWDFGNGSFNKQATGGEGMLSYLISPAINIPSTACEDHGVLFSFQHWRDWGDSSRYDAGNVKISTDGNDGPWTLIVPEEGYDGTVPSSWGNPLAGELAWGGTSDWTIASFDLTEYIGENIHIRWDAGVEAYTGMYGAGWRVDDLFMDALVVDEIGTAHNLVLWAASPCEVVDEVSHYHVYRSELQTGPWDESTLVDMVIADGSDVYEFYDYEKGSADDILWWYVVRAVGMNGAEENNTHAVQEPEATNIPPVASFDFIPSDPTVDDVVSFDGSGSYDPDGSIVNWTWDMGDETILYGEFVEYQYTLPSTYVVCLTVMDDEGAVDSVCEEFVVTEFLNEPPIAAFSYLPLAPTTADVIAFTDLSYDPDGYIVEWYWDFGDGSDSTDQHPTHQYATAGTYTVCLTVTDNDGAWDIYCDDVVVTEALVEILDVNQSLSDRGFRLMPGWDAAQEFISSYPVLSRVELYMTTWNDPAYPIPVEIRKDDPIGDVLFSSLIYPADVTASFPEWGWVSIDVGVAVEVGETYVIVLRDSADDDFNHLMWGVYTSFGIPGPYPDGNMLFRKLGFPTWMPIWDFDCAFKTYGLI